jgi:hypothetical protein
LTRASQNAELISLVPESINDDITEDDQALFERITNTELSAAQQKAILTPGQVYPRQRNVLAVHWHPEFIPMELTLQRVGDTFPNKSHALIIPTQHNQLVVNGDYAGVEVDCYSSGFNQKVQMLLHFKKERLAEAAVFKKMLEHTFRYRSSQLFEFIHTLVSPVESRLNQAAAETGAGRDLIRFARVGTKKLEKLLIENETDVPPIMIKNKLIRNFFNGLRVRYGDAMIDRVQVFLKAVKKLVKADFSLHYFYRTSEFIEEARSLGAGIVIPHPEQFWPILLADYDVDGYEVWNPQSRRYTEFLISVLAKKNASRNNTRRRLMVFMGDDTHMGEKIIDPAYQNPEKAAREIGLQSAWEEMNIRKTLIVANWNRRQVIAEYKERLNG